MNYTSLTDFLGNFAPDNNNLDVCMDQVSTSSDTPVLGFCRGSASVPRGFVSVEVGAETSIETNQSQCENTAAVVDTGRAAPLMGEQCGSRPHL